MDKRIVDLINISIRPIIRGYDEISVEFHVSDNLYTDALRFCENKRYLAELKSFSPNEIAISNKYNGAYLYPRDVNSIQHILISKNQFDSTNSYLSTAAHEVTHAINNTAFCKRYCGENYDSLFDHKKLEYFKTWDEYNAYKMGHLVYCTITMPKYMGYSESEVANEILPSQLPLRLRELEEIFSTTSNIVERIKKALYIVAKFSVWSAISNVDLSQVDKRLLKAMHVFDKHTSVETLDLDEIVIFLEKLVKEFSLN